MPSSRGKRIGILGLLLAIVMALGAAAWMGLRGTLPEPLLERLSALLDNDPLPDGFFVGTGRIEATELDVATKLAGRLVDVLAQEGDLVEAGAVVARLDTATLEAQERQARAELRRAEQDREYALAVVRQRESEREFALREWNRLKNLGSKDYASAGQVDQAATQSRTAEAALHAARVKVLETEAAIQAAHAQIERIAVDIDDSALKAPRRGRVLYRLAEPGEVLGIGGKVFTLLDLTDVYMVLFLPEVPAGQVALGAEVRIVLDAGPEFVFPAEISFVAARAQFTPRQVETRSEREKLAFRTKARVDPKLLVRYEPLVKAGLPGVAYVRLEHDTPWPEWLDIRLPPWPESTSPSPD